MRRLVALLAVAVTAASGLGAESHPVTLPALFDLVGIVPGGAVNVRARPENGAPIVGAVGGGSRAIEVVATDRFADWAMINLGERSGWVAMRFLRARAEIWSEAGLPTGLRCFGVEPFWSIRRNSAGLAVSTPEGGALQLELTAALAPGGPKDPSREVVAQGEDVGLTAILAPIACTDGMSDRQYGMRADVVLERNGEPTLLLGCCSVAP